MPSRLAHRFVAASALLWASAGAAAALLPPGTPGAVPAAAGLLLGGAALAAAIGPRRFAGQLAALPPGPLLLATAAMALFQWSFFAAIPIVGVGISAFVSSAAAPFFADAVAAVGARQRLPRRWLLALLCAVCGTLAFALGGQARLAGLVLATASGAAYALYALAAARLERDRQSGGLAGTAVALFGAGLAVLPAATGHLSALATPRGLAVTAYLGLACTALAYRLFVAGLRHLAPARALTLLLMQPAAAALLGMLLLGERPGLVELAGSALVAVAALLHTFSTQEIPALSPSLSTTTLKGRQPCKPAPAAPSS